MAFNPNELILERIRSVEEYDPITRDLTARYLQIEEPSLQTSAEGTDVTDALGTPIVTFYRNQQAQLSFTNSLFSLDLAASQFGTEKNVADTSNKIQMPTSEIITINSAGENPTATLKYVPVDGTLKYVKVVNADKTFGETYSLDVTAEDKKFSIADKVITLPAGVTGRVFVSYVRESESAVSVAKTNNSLPQPKIIWMHAIFHDPCNQAIKYAGVIVAENAQIDPSTIEIGLASDSKHSATYQIRPNYCDEEDSKLFEILVSKD